MEKRMNFTKRSSLMFKSIISVRHLLLVYLLLFVTCDKNPSDSGNNNNNQLITPAFSSTPQEAETFLSKGSGSKKAKLVFVTFDQSVGQKELCYIDFNIQADTLTVQKISGALGAKIPVISPDGNWVVYATGEGAETGSPLSARSSIYLSRLEPDANPVLVAKDSACEPRFMQNKNTLTVIYSTLAPNYAWEGFGKTMKVEIVTSGQTPVVGTPEVLYEYGSYTGGLSWDGKYLCSGGGHIVMLDITSGKTRPDTVSVFAQSCNSSISSSRKFTNTMMHMTTGGSDPSIDNGNPWKKWQMIFINDNSGKIVKWFKYPTTYKYPLETDPPSFSEARWHHCEWSNHPYFAAATLNADRFFDQDGSWVNTYYQERLYLVNLKDSEYLELARINTIEYRGIQDDASGFYWPWLWVEVPTGFVEDDSWLGF